MSLENGSHLYINDLVSVIIPVYNASAHLEETMNSVFSQTYNKIEIVLVDDCSTDSSAQIISKKQDEHTNIVYYKQERNRGAGMARNKALEIAKGQFIAFLDADDLWLPEKISKQLALMKETGSPFSYTAIEMIDENGSTLKSKRKIRKSIDYNFLLSNTMIATSSVVIDRNYYGNFQMHNRRGGQDYATWLKLLRNGVIACGVDDVLVRYRITKNSLSSNKLKSLKQIWEIQSQEEQINKIKVLLNIIKWCINVVKKYFF